MKKTRWLLFSFTLLVTLLLNNCFASSETTTIKIVYVSKITDIQPKNDNYAGLAELSTLVKELRNNNDHVLFLHGGDSLAPSAMSSFDHGNHMIDILNGLGPNLMAVNEREFTYGEDELIIRLSEAAFPFISSNIYDPYTNSNLDGVEDYQCFNTNGKKICVLSIVDPAVLTTYLPDRIQILDSPTRIRRISDNLKAGGADSIILLSGYHFGGFNTLFEEGVVDAVFTSDGNIDEAVIFDNGLHVIQGTNKGKAAVVDLIIEENGDEIIKSYKAEIVNLNNFEADPAIQERINYYTDKLSKIMDVIIGRTTTPQDTTREAVRTRENSFANLTTDALRDYYKADIALINGGTFRGDRLYPANIDITRKHIQAELPFLNHGQLVKIKGIHIQEAMEHGLSLFEKIKGRFLHVSGMKVEYCTEKPIGSRIQSILVDGKPLDINHYYTLAANDYLLNGGDGFDMLKQGEAIDHNKNNLLIWVILRSYIEKTKTISSVIDGRLATKCQ